MANLKIRSKSLDGLDAEIYVDGEVRNDILELSLNMSAGKCTITSLTAPTESLDIEVETEITESVLFDFGQALKKIKDGYKVARHGWNGKGMFLQIVKPAIPKEHAHEQFYMGFESYRVTGFHDDSLLPWIGMKTADNKFVPWLASQTDILADDWVTVE